MNRFEKIYKDVPLVQKEWLKKFREMHHYHHLNVGDINWKYIKCGMGKEVVVMLPGSVRSAEVWAKLISYLEPTYRIISPTYPAIENMEEGVEGIKGILEKEKARRIILMGSSFGGWLAQVFVRKHPGAVKKLILSNTSTPDSVMSRSLLEYTRFTLPRYPEKILKLIYKRSYLKILSEVGEDEKQFWKALITELLCYYTTKKEIITMFSAIRDFARNYSFNVDDLKRWRGKILIIESSDDIHKDDSREKLRDLYPRAEVKTLKDAGHTAGYTAPPAYVRAVKNFLSA
jgi:pimeloyl-ACP methyl ester carboxylesterase